MPENDNKDWREIAERASKESDSEKLLDLARQLEKALDQQQNVLKKMPDTAHGEGSGQKAS